MFRNIRFYRFHGTWPNSESALSKKLANAEFAVCGTFADQSAGWEPPGGEAEELLARRVGGADLLRLRIQSRVMPAAAVNEALEDRVAAFRARTARDPSRKEKRDLKDEVIAELRPRTLLKSQRVWGCYIEREQVLAIDTASETQAELFLDTLRDALSSAPVTPLSFKKPLPQLLTQVFLGSGPPNFVSGRECRMVDPSLGRASVNWLDIDLKDASVQKHVRDGLQLERLALGFDEMATLVLDTDCVVRKLRLEGIRDEDVPEEEEEAVQALAALDSQFVLITGVMARLLGTLKKQLGGYD